MSVGDDWINSIRLKSACIKSLMWSKERLESSHSRLDGVVDRYKNWEWIGFPMWSLWWSSLMWWSKGCLDVCWVIDLYKNRDWMGFPMWSLWWSNLSQNKKQEFQVNNNLFQLLRHDEFFYNGLNPKKYLMILRIFFQYFILGWYLRDPIVDYAIRRDWSEYFIY